MSGTVHPQSLVHTTLSYQNSIYNPISYGIYDAKPCLVKLHFKQALTTLTSQNSPSTIHKLGTPHQGSACWLKQHMVEVTLITWAVLLIGAQCNEDQISNILYAFSETLHQEPKSTSHNYETISHGQLASMASLKIVVDIHLSMRDRDRSSSSFAAVRTRMFSCSSTTCNNVKPGIHNHVPYQNLLQST